ncbi:MAG TPA: hypothetical protein VGA78_12940, partial [Gemmatimonadales bacterium]
MHRRQIPGFLVLATIAGTASLPAQDSTVSPPPPVVGRIELTRRNIFADSEATFFAPRLVNRFHVTTRPYVIERELLFERGQALRPDALEETARNLRRLGVFRRVLVDTVRRGATLVALVETQ